MSAVMQRASDYPAINVTGGPCAACTQADRCATKFIACPDFRRYVISGRTVYHDRKPSRAIYQQVFNEDA